MSKSQKVIHLSWYQIGTRVVLELQRLVSTIVAERVNGEEARVMGGRGKIFPDRREGEWIYREVEATSVTVLTENGTSLSVTATFRFRRFHTMPDWRFHGESDLNILDTDHKVSWAYREDGKGFPTPTIRRIHKDNKRSSLGISSRQ